MKFAAPEYLWLLIGLILFGVFIFWRISQKKALLSRFGDIPLIMRTAPFLSFARQRTKATCIIIGLAFLILAVARLQFGTHLESIKREGLDIVVAMDVSTSMLAQDQQPNRLEHAKRDLRSIVSRLNGDRIGLVSFAGDAFVQCPLTLDYAAAEMVLAAIDQYSVETQGTNLGAAIEKATAVFKQQDRKYKVLVLLTDGEDNEEQGLAAAEEARKQGIKIYTVGIGSAQGVPIPEFDQRGNQIGLKRGEDGEVVVTKLDEPGLQKIALTTGGKYYRSTGSEMELDRLFTDIGALEKKELEGTLVTRYDDQYQWPLLIALILILFEFFLSERRRPRQEELVNA